MLNFYFKQHNGTVVLTLLGNLISSRAYELRKVLLRSLYNSDNLMLDFEKVTTIDDFCVQQIQTANKISKRLNKRFTMLGLNPELLDIINESDRYSVLATSATEVS